jgi:YD repeat-containing protein
MALRDTIFEKITSSVGADLCVRPKNLADTRGSPANLFRFIMKMANGASGPYNPMVSGYDNLNRLTGVTVSGQTYNYGYTGASPVVQSLTRPDTSVTGYQYDGLNRLTQMITTVSGVTVSQYGYTYNQQDLRDGETTLDPTPAYADYLANYTYNNVNELTQVADPGSRNLTYDASGNLTGG